MMDQIFSVETLWWVLMCLFLLTTLPLIVLILLQQGKGGGLGGALGGGGGDNVFGAKSAQTMPVKLTYIGAAIFISLCILLSIVSGKVTLGDAPDLAPVLSDSASGDSSGSTTEMERLGLGTGVVDSGAHGGIDSTDTDALVVETPVTSEEPEVDNTPPVVETVVTEEESSDATE